MRVSAPAVWRTMRSCHATEAGPGGGYDDPRQLARRGVRPRNGVHRAER